VGTKGTNSKATIHNNKKIEQYAHKSIPTGAQYVTLQKYFSHQSLVISFFATPP
jgi:hypothetical protein